ncbi:npp1 domain-containing protein [Colletotrichum kahawae]|uniref:Npp1 domain-containing protein n=1 Tax=Colletotrichum kahawae TaxID=34407 RepID=A0AAD9Y5A5_COLKA|nr:npp1 domain-containing protein [Colletotrichum kahawae]
MILRARYLLTVCLFFSEVAVSAILPRDGDDYAGHPEVNHDEVAAFKQDSSPGIDGRLELMFNPQLVVTGGCDPYPAVDANGGLGQGLRPTGGGRSGCGNGGSGQVYARRGSSHDRDAIIYSFYFPKVKDGHRHYWASIVVWIYQGSCDIEKPSSYRPVGVSYTTDHETWGFSGSDLTSKDSPTSFVFQFHDKTMSPFRDADIAAASRRTLISWMSLPEKARQALTDVKYEKTKVPFTDANLQASLDTAYQESFYLGLKDGQDCNKIIQDV